MKRKSIAAVGLTLGLLAVSLILSGPIDGLEQQLLTERFRFRGELPPDTNIVILYFDNDDIASLGGSDLKRLYYGLLIDVLKKSGVSVIGIDVFFGEHNLQFPQYDSLLASTATAAGNVVASCYFRRIDPHASASASPELALQLYPAVSEGGLLGSQLQLPFAELREAVKGLGHTNLDPGPTIGVPVLVNVGGGSVAAFGFEAVRLFLDVPREGVRIAAGSINLHSPGSVRSLSFSRPGIVDLNFPGSLSSFKVLRCVEVLRSYQLQQLGVTPPIDLAALRNKVVLVSVIGEGRSRFFVTPFDGEFPSVGIHATFIDNALTDRFLTRAPAADAAAISLILAVFALVLVFRIGYLNGFMFSGLTLLIYVVATQIAFSMWCATLPIVQPVFLVVTVSLGMFLYEHLTVRKRVAQLERDKEEVESKLRASELNLQMLEQELMDEKTGDRPARGTELVDEIKRYKLDIKTLSAQVSDLVRFEPLEIGQDGGKAVFEGIVYNTSGKMREAVELIQKVSASDTNVLILGESGTGKELVARAIHNLSPRKGNVFAAVNCGALTETLLESELFGHERGSFTGAVKDKVGRFEYADGGTIFLDEIAETSEAFQVKLLRIVQSGEFERVGSTLSRRANIRIVAATNKSLRDLVAEKRFREDLYYRLNVFSLELPPLRERKGDISILAEHFLKRNDAKLSFSSTVMDAFLQYQWPGNVRELDSAITRATIMARAEQRELLQLRDLPEQIASALKGQVDLEDQIIELLRAKKFSRSSISETAEELGGLNRGTVAEYFRGVCFRYFFENLWDTEKTVRAISKSEEEETNDRVTKKLSEYLANVVDGITGELSFEQTKQNLRPKYKNLPQRYHTILDEVVRSYVAGKWK
ncbi:MAG: CHASE2 domain-containing protein [Ignavibacteria bacterium]|nr:CHASE2 domain-containing protein [Ignavibacteria bacterium]